MSMMVRSTPRRALLAAAAVVTLAAFGFLGARPLSAEAASRGTDGDVVLGVANQPESNPTGVICAPCVYSFIGISTNTIGVGLKGAGTAGGVYGNGNTYGVEGDGGTDGVIGNADTYGVEGSTSTGSGVFGHNSGSTGYGVYGQTGGNGSAVYGQATGVGTGVYGDTTNGTGVLAHSTNGTALWVNGSAHFSQSGIAGGPSGSNHVIVTMSVASTASMILATLQQGGGFYVKYAQPGSGSFTIYLNKAPSAPTKVNVAFIVLN